MNLHVISAIFRRNFRSYFTNPTGYVFICLFVLLTAIAQFMPDAFFNENLANLDQLNNYFPLIMLLFIPAVTMGIWSEERREGTDELLLTMPAADVDVVIGKYLAALGIFTVALFFSASNVIVLEMLGTPDYGVIAANYFGYWLVGAAMLSLGMAASFLTRNLTVAFILGLIFNVPLVALRYGDSIFRDPQFAQALADWSIGERFRDFARGTVPLSGVVYFLAIPAVLLYLSMVFIGRRHWAGALRSNEGSISPVMYIPRVAIGLVLAVSFVGLLFGAMTFFWREGWDNVTPGVILQAVGGVGAWLAALAVALWFFKDSGDHYLIRTLCFGVIAGSLVVAAGRSGLRSDWSRDQLSDLSPRTRELLAALRTKQGNVGATVAADRFAGTDSLLTLDGAYAGADLKFTDGPLKDQVRKVVGYVGATRTFEFASPFSAAPQPGNHFTLDRPGVTIEAFLSPRDQTPQEYVETRVNLETTLREIQSLAGGLVTVRLHETSPLSEPAVVASEQYSINPRQVQSASRGAIKVEDLFLGLAVVSGTQKVVLPFVDRGVPVEYEVVRAIASVGQQQKKRLGVVTTDVKLFGSFNMQSMQPTPDQAIITELQKQYELVQIDLSPKDAGDRAKDRQLLEDEMADLDALVAVQPSSLGPDQLERFLVAVRTGIPTAIFEDPFPYIDPSVPGSSPTFQRQAPNSGNPMFGGFQPPPPKGDVNRLWTFLGVNCNDLDVVAQDYNPYPRMRDFPPEFVFTGVGTGAEEPFNPDQPITNRLESLLFLFPGSIGPSVARKNIKFTPLVRTGRKTYEVNAAEIMERDPLGRQSIREERIRRSTAKEYVLAARVQGQLPPENVPMAAADATESAPAATGTATPEATAPTPLKTPRTPRRKGELNSVVVCDIDLLYSVFFAIRDRGQDPNSTINIDVDNVTFVLNILDVLAQDDRFLEIRNRRRKHRTLEVMEARESAARSSAEDQIAKFRDKNKDIEKELTDELRKEVDDIEKRIPDRITRMQAAQTAVQAMERRLKAKSDQLKLELEKEMTKIGREREHRIREMQAFVKLQAIVQAPIIPLLIGLGVFLLRRLRETEGVAKNRLV